MIKTEGSRFPYLGLVFVFIHYTVFPLQNVTVGIDLTAPSEPILFFFFVGEVEDELLHAYSKVYTFDTPLLMVRLAVLVAVTLTVPIVLFPVST